MCVQYYKIMQCFGVFFYNLHCNSRSPSLSWRKFLSSLFHQFACPHRSTWAPCTVLVKRSHLPHTQCVWTALSAWCSSQQNQHQQEELKKSILYHSAIISTALAHTWSRRSRGRWRHWSWSWSWPGSLLECW